MSETRSGTKRKAEDDLKDAPSSKEAKSNPLEPGSVVNVGGDFYRATEAYFIGPTGERVDFEDHTRWGYLTVPSSISRMFDDPYTRYTEGQDVQYRGEKITTHIDLDATHPWLKRALGFDITTITTKEVIYDIDLDELIIEVADEKYHRFSGSNFHFDAKQGISKPETEEKIRAYLQAKAKPQVYICFETLNPTSDYKELHVHWTDMRFTGMSNWSEKIIEVPHDELYDAINFLATYGLLTRIRKVSDNYPKGFMWRGPNFLCKMGWSMKRKGEGDEKQMVFPEMTIS